MQEFLVNYALAVIAITTISGLAFGFNEYMPYRSNLELLGVIFVIRLLILATNKFQSRWPILEYLLEFGMVLAVVLSCGWILDWYDANYFGQMFITILVVYVGIYAVGFGRARRDAAFINEQIKQRRMQLDIKQKEGTNREDN
jgi:hypothetical protein